MVAVAQATADLYKDFDPRRETWEEFGRRVIQAERTLTSLGFGVDVPPQRNTCVNRLLSRR